MTGDHSTSTYKCKLSTETEEDVHREDQIVGSSRDIDCVFRPQSSNKNITREDTLATETVCQNAKAKAKSNRTVNLNKSKNAASPVQNAVSDEWGIFNDGNKLQIPTISITRQIADQHESSEDTHPIHTSFNSDTELLTEGHVANVLTFATSISDTGASRGEKPKSKKVAFSFSTTTTPKKEKLKKTESTTTRQSRKSSSLSEQNYRRMSAYFDTHAELYNPIPTSRFSQELRTQGQGDRSSTMELALPSSQVNVGRIMRTSITSLDTYESKKSSKLNTALRPAVYPSHHYVAWAGEQGGIPSTRSGHGPHIFRSHTRTKDTSKHVLEKRSELSYHGSQLEASASSLKVKISTSFDSERFDPRTPTAEANLVPVARGLDGRCDTLLLDQHRRDLAALRLLTQTSETGHGCTLDVHSLARRHFAEGQANCPNAHLG